MNSITLAESSVEFRAGLPLGGWPGRDRVYVTLTLGIGPRLVPILTASILGGSTRWTYRGWRAFVLFERLAGRMIDAKGIEAHGLVRSCTQRTPSNDRLRAA